MCPPNLRCIITAGSRSAQWIRRAPVCSCCAFIFAVAACGLVGADSNRRTTDWQADLISVLVERRMTDTAASICQRHFSEAEPLSGAAARWAIRWSDVEASDMLRSESVTQDQVNAAKKPVADLLQSYDQHERRLWLHMQLAMVDFAAAQHAAVAYAVAAHRDDLQALALERISSTLRQLDDIDESLKSELSRVASAQGEAAITSGELIALQQNLGKQRVAALLLRSNLFPDRSEDAVASAAQAVASADAVLTRMQSNTSLRSEVLLLKAEAVYRSGDPASAQQLLDDLEQSLHAELPAEALALRVRIAVETDPAEAASILASYYGNDPVAAPVSLEMDLARLRWLLEESTSQDSTSTDQATAQVADWLDAIERRGGVYARRRGEAEALHRIRVAPGSSDVRLLAAEAAKRLRAGEANAAANLLMQAATSAQQPEQAIRYARQAAAVFVKAEQPDRASEILVQTARTHASEPAAAKAHLQAALLISNTLKGSSQPDAEPLIELLKEHAVLWPQEPTTEKAMPWLLNILTASRRHAEAARFLMNRAELSAEEIRLAGELWRSALRASGDPTKRQRLVEEAIVLFTSDPGKPSEIRRAADWQAVWIAASFGAPRQLQSVQSRLPNSSEGIAASDELFDFIRSLVRFRLEGSPASVLETEQLATHRSAVVDAIERLRADGEDSTRDHRRLGTAMQRLFEVLHESDGADGAPSDFSIDPFTEPLANVWTGEWKEAQSQLESMVQQASRQNRADVIEQAAAVLTDSDATDGQRAAIGYWNRLAQGLPQGSPRWHRAKLAVARLLIDLGETAEAKQLCQFVLITRPPDDPDVRAEYEAILQR